jgi:hypothetical protein
MVQVQDVWFKAWLDAMGYQMNPYVEQIIATLENQNPRFMLIYGGERSGKSFNTVAALGKKLKPNAYPEQRSYWIVGPDYASTRAEFDYIYIVYKKLGLVEKVSMPESPNQRWTMDLKTNERWETKTSHDVRRLASFTIYGALIVEANRQEPDVWPKIRGRLAEKRGWALISGTYENTSEWFVDLYEKWSVPNREGAFSFSLPTWANTVAFPGGENDEEIIALRESTPKEWFEERYGGIPTKPSNLVIPEFEYVKHVGLYELDPTLPVELAIDPAKHTYAIVFVQKRDGGAVVLDAVYKHGWIAQQIIPEARRNSLWPYVKMNDGYHGAIDIAGFQEPGNISQAELWRDMAGITLYAQRYPEMETINAVRYALAENRLRFNNLGNESYNGIAIEPLAEFRLWRKRGITDSGIIGQPIDRNNDFIKALGYWWLYRFGQVDKRPRGPLTREHASTVGRHQRDNSGARDRQTLVQERRRRFRESMAARLLDKR